MDSPAPSTKSRRALFTLVVLIFAAGHLPFLGSGWTNLECWTAKAASRAGAGDPAGAVTLLHDIIASPPFYALALGPVTAAFGDSPFVVRMPALLLALLTLWVVWRGGGRLFGAGEALLAAAFLAFNPLFWTYSCASATFDLPFTCASACLAFAVLGACESDRPGAHFAAGLWLGVCLLIKYNAVAWLPAVFLCLMTAAPVADGTPLLVNLKTALRRGLWYLPGIIAAFVVLYALSTYTGELLSERADSSRVSRLPEYLILAPLRLSAYLIWIGALSGGFVLAGWFSRAREGARAVARSIPGWLPILNAALIAGVEWARASRPGFLGELDLGWIAHLASAPALWLLEFLLLCMGETVLAHLFRWIASGRGSAARAALWVIAGLAVHTLNRGAARYLMAFLPLLAVLLAAHYTPLLAGARRAGERLIVAASLAGGLALGLFSTAYFAVEGDAAEALVRQVNAEPLRDIRFEVSNSVLAHCGCSLDESLHAPPGPPARWVFVTYAPGDDTSRARFVTSVEMLGKLWKRYGIEPVSGIPGESPP